MQPSEQVNRINPMFSLNQIKMFYKNFGEQKRDYMNSVVDNKHCKAIVVRIK